MINCLKTYMPKLAIAWPDLFVSVLHRVGSLRLLNIITLYVFIFVITMVFPSIIMSQNLATASDISSQSNLAAKRIIPVATVRRATQPLEYRESENDSWKAAEINTKLYHGYQVRSGEGGFGVIYYPIGKSEVVMNQSTEIAIESEARFGRNKGSIARTKVFKGEIYADISAGANHEIETPDAVANTNGASLTVSLDDQEETFAVHRSNVDITNSQGTTTVYENRVLYLEDDIPPNESFMEWMKGSEKRKSIAWVHSIKQNWILELIPDGGASQKTNQPFAVDVFAIDSESGRTADEAELETYIISSPELKVSRDGLSWSDSLPVPLKNGYASILAKSEENTPGEIMAQASWASDSRVTILFAGPSQAELLQAEQASMQEPTLDVQQESAGLQLSFDGRLRLKAGTVLYGTYTYNETDEGEVAQYTHPYFSIELFLFKRLSVEMFGEVSGYHNNRTQDAQSAIKQITGELSPSWGAALYLHPFISGPFDPYIGGGWMKSNYYQGIREQVYSEGEGYRAVAGTNIFFNNQWFVGADASYNMLDYKANQYFQDFSLDAMIVRGYTGLAF